MKMLASIRAFAIPLLISAAVPAVALAQAQDDRSARADAIFEMAVQKELNGPEASFRRHLNEVARLHLRSASMRDVSDPRKIESLERAGTLLYSVNPRRAHLAMAEAAELALIHGHVARSARSFLDAAAVIQTKGLSSREHQKAAAEYARSARMLADHPVLDVEQRDAILARMDLGRVATR
jgi:hypothetical protein